MTFKETQGKVYSHGSERPYNTCLSCPNYLPPRENIAQARCAILSRFYAVESCVVVKIEQNRRKRNEGVGASL